LTQHSFAATAMPKNVPLIDGANEERWRSERSFRCTDGGGETPRGHP
jgi:hypothetical protein